MSSYKERIHNCMIWANFKRSVRIINFPFHVSFSTVCALLIAIFLQVLEEDVLLAASEGDQYLF